MSTPVRSNEGVQFYSSGVGASIFKADGSGFIYYPSGNVAIYKGVINGRGRFYIYDKNPKSTPIGAVNEYAVGFFMGPNRMRLALSRVSVIQNITDIILYKTAHQRAFASGALTPHSTLTATTGFLTLIPH